MMGAWKESYTTRCRYRTSERHPYYDVAARYLPEAREAILLDVGAGDAEFADHLDLSSKYDNVYLLDSNPTSVERLKIRYRNAMLHKVPDRLPFDDSTVQLVHCSHLVEHLEPRAVYDFLREVDRVLAVGGVLVVSAPVMWDHFYDDLSHVKPYNPLVFWKYLCENTTTATAETISTSYTEEELVWSVRDYDISEEWGSENAAVDFLIYLWAKVLWRLGIRRYKRHGYTLVLRKSHSGNK